MARLIPCPSCSSHVLANDRECPHCGAVLRTAGAPLAAAVIAGLMLVGCADDAGDDVGEPEYGVPVTTTADTVGSTAAASDDTAAGTTAGTSDGTTTADSITGTGGVEYGTADFGDELTGTETEGTTGTGTTSVGEPEYGVPETSSSSG